MDAAKIALFPYTAKNLSDFLKGVAVVAGESCG